MKWITLKCLHSFFFSLNLEDNHIWQPILEDLFYPYCNSFTYKMSIIDFILVILWGMMVQEHCVGRVPRELRELGYGAEEPTVKMKQSLCAQIDWISLMGNGSCDEWGDIGVQIILLSNKSYRTVGHPDCKFLVLYDLLFIRKAT